MTTTVRRRRGDGEDQEAEVTNEVFEDQASTRPHHPLSKQESREAAYLGCALDYDPNEIESENDREMLKSVSIYGLFFILLSGTDLAVNFLVFESQTNADGNFYTGHSYSFDTEKQMMLGSVARCVFTVIYILFVSIDGIYSKYPDVIRYILGSIYYIFYCHILVCVLIDSERSDFEYDFMYWCCLLLNVVWTTGHFVLAILIWKAWAKRAYKNIDSISDGTSTDGTSEQSEQSVSDAAATDKEIAKGRKSKRKEDLDDKQVPRTVPISVLVKKMLVWYKSELFWIILSHVLLTAAATSM